MLLCVRPAPASGNSFSPSVKRALFQTETREEFADIFNNKLTKLCHYVLLFSKISFQIPISENSPAVTCLLYRYPVFPHCSIASFRLSLPPCAPYSDETIWAVCMSLRMSPDRTGGGQKPSTWSAHRRSSFWSFIHCAPHPERKCHQKKTSRAALHFFPLHPAWSSDQAPVS